MDGDLISRRELMEVFRARMVEIYDKEKCGSDENCKECKPGCFWRRAIVSVQSVDAVPVVRCKDCAVPHNKWTGCPNLNGLVPPPNHFCSFGERKDNG